MDTIVLRYVFVMLVLAVTKQVCATKFLSRGFLHQDSPFVKLSGLSWDECLSECQRRFSCKSVIFRRHIHSCRLYDQLSSGTSGDPNLGTVYGLPAWRNTREHADTTCSQRECNEVDCGPIPAVNNAFFVDHNTTFGSNVTYMCNSGYLQNDGSDITFCSQHGQWTPTTIACTSIDCGPIPAVNNAFFVDHNTTFGSNVTYMCNSGYLQNDGSDITFCSQHGQWTPTTIACTSIDCGPIPAVNNAFFVDHNTTFGSNVTYMCNSGYLQNDGSDITFCSQHGQWTPTTIACTSIDCGPIPAVNNAFFVDHNTTFGSNVTYMCNSGYLQNDGSDITFCSQHGQWTPTTIVCTSIDCGPIPAVNNAFSVDHNTTFGSNVTYMCNSGYLHNDGSNITFCSRHGQWTPTAFACAPIDCGSIPAVKNAFFVDHNTTFGSNVTYMCNSGYLQNDGSDITFCSQHGQWTPTTIACTSIDCGPIPAVNNAFSVDHNTTFGSNVTYMCNRGYLHNDGSNITFCSRHGQWTPTAFACAPIDCGPIPAVNNAFSVDHNTTFGNNVTYMCNSGYLHNDGSEITFCSRHGQWTPTTIVCTPIDCGPIPAVNNAFSVDHNTTFGSNVTYMCNSGYIHNDGSDITFCSRLGQWTPTTIVCTPIDCGQPNVTSRVVTERGSTFYGTIRTISCANGYESDASGLSESALVCQSNGTWSETEFACELNITGIGDFGNFRSDSFLVQSQPVQQTYGEATFTDVTLYECAEKCRTETKYCIALNYNTENSTCTLADRFLQRLLQTATGWDILYKKVGVYFTHGPDGWYTLKYESAFNYCVQAGSAIASRSDIESAFNKGLNVDQCGWIEEGYAVIMLHHPVPGVYTTTGVTTCTWSNTWGVFCKSSSLPPL